MILKTRIVKLIQKFYFCVINYYFNNIIIFLYANDILLLKFLPNLDPESPVNFQLNLFESEHNIV